MINKYEITLNHIVTVANRSINSLDKTFLNHGEEVAYIMFNLLKAHGGYSRKKIRRLCVAATFHDIGLYKLSRINNISSLDEAENETEFRHAVYGALFMKYFSPISDLYEVIFYHHFDYKYFKSRGWKIPPEECLLLNLADNIDRIYVRNDKKGCFNKENYLKEHLDLLHKANKEYDFINKLKNKVYEKELRELFSEELIYRDEVIEYSKMLAYAIDFRSESTVEHTITVEAISYQIGKMMGIDEETLDLIKLAAALHDIGKIGIPMEILEKPGKLTVEEFEIIKGHTMIGYELLSGLNIDDIRDIGILHHEKLDGSGYPFGLKGDEICTEIRIVAISDIIGALIGTRSYKKEFSKEKVISILNEMADDNKIDKYITDLFINNYDYIIEEARKEAHLLIDRYQNMKKEYIKITAQLDKDYLIH